MTKIYGIGGAIHRGDPRGPQGERHRRGRSMLLYFWVTARQRCSVVAPGRLAKFCIVSYFGATWPPTRSPGRRPRIPVHGGTVMHATA